MQSLAGEGGGLSGDRYCLSLNLGTLALEPHLTVEQICCPQGPLSLLGFSVLFSSSVHITVLMTSWNEIERGQSNREKGACPLENSLEELKMFDVLCSILFLHCL